MFRILTILGLLMTFTITSGCTGKFAVERDCVVVHGDCRKAGDRHYFNGRYYPAFVLGTTFGTGPYSYRRGETDTYDYYQRSDGPTIDESAWRLFFLPVKIVWVPAEISLSVLFTLMLSGMDAR